MIAPERNSGWRPRGVFAHVVRGTQFVVLVLLAGVEARATGEVVRPHPGALEPPAPVYEVAVERDVWIAMRDHVRLAADVYRPQGKPGRLPVILMRTPYSKDKGIAKDARYFAGHGFAVVVQDFRGRFKSEGEYLFTRGHRNDGYDTAAWIVAQPWSNGRIGSYGCSYVGEVQLYQAPAAPPGLVAMIPQAAGSATGSAGRYFHNAQDLGGGAWGVDIHFDWWYRNGGKLFYAPRQEALVPTERRADVASLYSVGPQMPKIDYRPVLESLPVVDMMRRVVAPPNDWADFVRHNVDLTDPWWRQFDYVAEDTRIDVPTLFIESWNDYTAAAAAYLRNKYERTAASAVARNNQFIIISPAQHCGSESLSENQYIGDQFVGDPRFGHWDIYLKWFRHWLGGESNALADMPKVQYYVMGENRWKASNHWPIPGMQPTRYYLRSAGGANSHSGNGRLSRAAPTVEPADTYTYDPASPVPSLGTNDYQQSKPIADQRAVSMRNDVLVYTSEPLSKGFEMTGEIEVVLSVSSSAPDTDFVAKLVDVYPDGRALNVRENILRARYRDGRDKPAVFMKPGEVYQLRIPLGAYSMYFEAGHRIRIQIASASFPRYDRNLNTGGNNFDEVSWHVATNKVHHEARHLSYLVLPVIPSDR